MISCLHEKKIYVPVPFYVTITLWIIRQGIPNRQANSEIRRCFITLNSRIFHNFMFSWLENLILVMQYGVCQTINDILASLRRSCHIIENGHGHMYRIITSHTSIYQVWRRSHSRLSRHATQYEVVSLIVTFSLILQTSCNIPNNRITSRLTALWKSLFAGIHSEKIFFLLICKDFIHVYTIKIQHNQFITRGPLGT